MKNTLLTLIMLFFALSGFSQGVPCTVFNNINSGSVTVQLFASPIGNCQVGCATQTRCIFPGGVEVFDPCGPDFFEWSYAVVTPTTDECSTPCFNGGVTIVSPTGCLPSTDTDFHCHAGSLYTSNFVGPTLLFIN